MTRAATTGAAGLVRLILRRDRVLLTGWIMMLLLVGIGTAAYYLDLFATEESRLLFAREAAAAPVLLAFNGELHGSGVGVVGTWRMRDLSYTLIALMTVLTVIRHTRAEEESGRQELIGATAVGRHAPLTAALAVGFTAGVVVAVLIGTGLIALGLDPVGSLAYMVAAAGAAAVFAAVAALAAQVSATARGATGLAVLTLAASYLIRFVADGSGQHWLTWFSPLGWAHLVRPFADVQWWVSVVTVTAAVLLVAAACRVAARRDFGAGLLPTRPGPERGRLNGPMALAWRLQRGLLGAWVVGFAIAGLFFGALAAGVSGSSIGASSTVLTTFVQRYTGSATAGMDDAFLWVIALTLGYTAALYPALAVVRLRTEESSGRAESLLAAPVSRLRIARGHVVLAAAGTVGVLAAGGLAAGSVYGLATGDLAGQLPRILAGTLIQVPAAWILGALTLLAFGLLPRLTATVAWVGFLLIQMFETIGPILGLEFRFVEMLIPYWHLPRILSGGDFTAVPLVVLTALAAVGVAAGLTGWRRRDLAPTG